MSGSLISAMEVRSELSIRSKFSVRTVYTVGFSNLPQPLLSLCVLTLPEEHQSQGKEAVRVFCLDASPGSDFRDVQFLCLEGVY